MRRKAERAYQRVSLVARLPWLAGVVEDISHPADSVDQLAVEGLVDLRPQAADVDVDDVGAAVEVHVPDLFGDGGARQHLTGAADQQRGQGELLGRQVELLPRAHRAVPPE